MKKFIKTEEVQATEAILKGVIFTFLRMQYPKRWDREWKDIR